MPSMSLPRWTCASKISASSGSSARTSASKLSRSACVRATTSFIPSRSLRKAQQGRVRGSAEGTPTHALDRGATDALPARAARRGQPRRKAARHGSTFAKQAQALVARVSRGDRASAARPRRGAAVAERAAHHACEPTRTHATAPDLTVLGPTLQRRRRARRQRSSQLDRAIVAGAASEPARSRSACARLNRIRPETVGPAVATGGGGAIASVSPIAARRAGR